MLLEIAIISYCKESKDRGAKTHGDQIMVEINDRQVCGDEEEQEHYNYRDSIITRMDKQCNP